MAISAVTQDRDMPRRYRFAGVVVDEGASRLLVDGRPCACSQRALQLLLCLCESPQRTLGRAELIDRLWPGGQIVADEALTQAVFRARAVLGRHAALVVTVRGVGFRLDSAVERLSGDLPDATPPAVAGPPVTDPPASAAATPGAAPTAPATAAAAARPRLILLLGLLGLLLLVAAFRHGGDWTRPDPVVDDGYALHAGDLGGRGEDSLRLLGDAFRHEGEGDRARARALLETVHASDPDTPVPALFLALWSVGGGDNAEADRWLADARQRLDGHGSPYLNALLAYVEAERGDDRQDVLRRAGALLDLRPGAWQMRIARAHVMVGSGLRDAAAAELGRVDYADLGHRKLVMALADRASLGDVAGAAAVLGRIAPGRLDLPPMQYLRGRIAWSRGDYRDAAAAFARCSEGARRIARFDLVNRCLANVGAIAVIEQRDADAIGLLEQARTGMVESGWRLDEVDLSLMLAQLQAFAGHPDAVRRELDRADAVLRRFKVDSMRPWTLFYRARLAADGAPAAADGLPVAAQDLLAARAAQRAGDLAAARAALQRAQGAVDRDADWKDELRLLQLELDGHDAAPSAEPVIDPPYPPLARLTARAALLRALAAAPAGAPR